MAKKRGLTDKQMSNRRFRKTENAIFAAVLKRRKRLDVKTVIKEARISKATLYRHHQAVHRVLEDHENYLMNKYYRLTREILKNKKVNTNIIFYRLLIFITENKESLVVLMEESRAIERMVWRLRVRIIRKSGLPETSRIALRVCVKEVVGVIEEWGRQGFRKEEVEIVLCNVLYLIETVKVRLRKIL